MSEGETSAATRRGPLRLLWGMLVRPRSTLEYVGAHGRRAWWVPALLAVLLLVLPVLVAAPITAQQTREAILATQEQLGEQRGEKLSAEEQAQMTSIATSPLLTLVFPASLGIVGLVVGWLLRAGALYLAGTAVGGRSTFQPMFRVVVWTWFPYLLRGLLQTVYILVTGEIIANPGLSGFVRDNRAIGELVATPPSLNQILLASFLSRIDLFLAWNLLLLVIGVMVVTRLSRRKAVLITLGVWLLLTVLGLAPALVGGLFSQQGLFS